MLARLGLRRAPHFVDASETSWALAGVVEPERKRRIIGDMFIEVFEREARPPGDREPPARPGHHLPRHHRDRGHEARGYHQDPPQPRARHRGDDRGRAVVEPLAELYKVEVRELGERLGIPHDMLWRHPFPGPGLGVRLLCSDGSPDRAASTRSSPPRRTWPRRFGWRAVPPHPLGGRQGGPALLRAPGAARGRAALGARLRDRAVRRPHGRRPGINRCIWNWRAATPPGRPAARRYMTARASRPAARGRPHGDGRLRRHGLYDQIWQCPTVLVPLALDGGGRAVWSGPSAPSAP